MTQCGGHFGLSMKYYCHFTSPIRRYPDLQIHRIIKENIHGKMNDKRIGHYNQILPEVAEEASRLERRADDAEREVEKMKKAEYMEQFIGQSFDGVISGVTTWGMYVELPNTVEGMVRVADIPGDYYYFEEEKYRMVGERTGKSYKLGESIRITVSAVDKLTKTIDFTIADDSDAADKTGDASEKKVVDDEKKNSVKAVDKSTVSKSKSSDNTKSSPDRKKKAVKLSEAKRKTARKSDRKKKAVLKAKKKAVMEAKEKAIKAFEYRKKRAKKKAAAENAQIEHEVKKLTGAAKKRALNKAKKKAKKKAKMAKKLKK